MQTPTFLRVLRNLWLGSSLINPTLAFLAISVLPIAEISANRYIHGVCVLRVAVESLGSLDQPANQPASQPTDQPTTRNTYKNKNTTATRSSPRWP